MPRPASQDAELVLDARCRLGEGPLWDPRTDRLLWVDIEGRRVHWYRPRDGATASWAVRPAVGALGLRDAGGWVAADERGFGWLQERDGNLVRQPIADVLDEEADLRMNDGAVDPGGRFWAGSMAWDAAPGRGTLHRLRPDGTVDDVLAGLTIPNGIDWSPDGRTLYFVDTPTHRVDAYAFDVRTGGVGERRPFVEVDPAEGDPDGLTVDADGGVWVGLWGGWEARRYAPDGELTDRIRVPAAHVTKPWFGGPDLDELYVATARPPGAGSQSGDAAGGLFRARPRRRGQPPRFFGARG